MSTNATSPTIAAAYANLKSALSEISATASRGINRIDAGTVPYSVLTTELIPTLKNLLALVPDSALYPQAWIDKLAAYANDQTLSPSPDWHADYDANRVACAAAIAEAVSALPTNASGHVVIQSFANDGTETIDTAGDLTALRAALQLLIDTIG